ncbi:DUF4199 domain-containing protein [Aquimarina sp. AU474]|uniref:DUF4199 domain-containing protein n=1 Tax=Aquimarina sp. AU474 TaxID=2108529 RepID=UPI001359EE62|nr:DUF4199 domain-containing protein [Aquimarina sp. AU474]
MLSYFITFGYHYIFDTHTTSTAMKEGSISIKKYSIIYGIILGVLYIAYGTIFYVTLHLVKLNWFTIIIAVLLPILIIVHGLYTYKKANQTILKLNNALKIGAGIAFIATIMVGVWSIFLMCYFDPNLNSEIALIYEAWMIDSNPDISINELNEKMPIYQKYNTPFFISVILMLLIFVFGFLISLVSGSIMYKKKAP